MVVVVVVVMVVVLGYVDLLFYIYRLFDDDWLLHYTLLNLCLHHWLLNNALLNGNLLVLRNHGLFCWWCWWCWSCGWWMVVAVVVVAVGVGVDHGLLRDH